MKNVKEVHAPQILSDLSSGLTRYAKKDIGFGSIESKYQLTKKEVFEIFQHPKLKHRRTTIPVLVKVVDDIPPAVSSHEHKSELLDEPCSSQELLSDRDELTGIKNPILSFALDKLA